MAKLFILDDQKIRHELFEIRYKDHDIVSAYTATEAITALEESDFDYIFLDHDLGLQVYTVSNENSGYEVAKWISENYKNVNVRIIIHSFNPVGANNMLHVLFDAGFKNIISVPFPCNGYGPIKIKDKR